MDSPPFRALVVDDEEGIRRLAKVGLSRHGVDCDCASSGSEALGLLESRLYDLVLTDLRMPHGHGHSLCTSILARGDRPILVVLTGVLEQRLAEDLKARGVDRIYFKPVNFRNLCADLYGLIVARTQAARDKPPLTARSVPAPVAVAETQDSREPPPPTAVPAEPPPGQAHPPHRSRSDRPLIAVLRKTRAQSSSLARKLSDTGQNAVEIEGVDALRPFLASKRVRLLVLDNEREGYFTGIEILRKLRAGSVRIPVILVDANENRLTDEIHSLGPVTVVDSAANNEELAEAACRVLRKGDDQDDIPERARELVESQRELPVMSQVVFELLKYLERQPEEIPLADLYRAISIDPKASAVLLKAANASSNALVREIVSVADAVRVLGVRPTIGRILNAAVTDGMSALSQGLPADLQAWLVRREMLLAATASTFAKDLEGSSDESAFLLGLLQDAGILCLLRAHPHEYPAALARWRSVAHLKLGAIEQSDFGVTHAAVSAALMERWNMPRSLILPVLHHLESAGTSAHFGIDERVLRVMAIAEALVDLTDAPQPSRRHILHGLLAHYGTLRKSLTLRSLANSTIRAAEAFQLMDVPLPGAADLKTMVHAAIGRDPPGSDGTPLFSHGPELAKSLDQRS